MKRYEKAIDSGKLPFERGVILSDDDFIRKAVIMELMAKFPYRYRETSKRT